MSNCKPGDIAVIKPPSPKQLGRLVEVCYFGFPAHPRVPELGVLWYVRAIGWKQTECEELRDGDKFLFPDAMLRPIRDLPGPDETLSWKSVPTGDRITALRHAFRSRLIEESPKQ